MSDDYELARGRVLHFNESSWDALQDLLAKNHYTLMAQHVAEQRAKDVVTLDLDDFRWAAMVLRDPKIEAMGTRNKIAEQIEAQTRLARISEPGLWAVVEAWVDGIPTRRWVHHEEDRWIADTGERRFWDELMEPALIREGVN